MPNHERLAALSRTPFIQAASFLPDRSAASVYSRKRSLESLSSYRSDSGLSTGGLPRGRFMGLIVPVQKRLDKGLERVFNVRTLTNPTKEPQMNNATLQAFRQISAEMQPAEQNWQWVGKWMSQRMFGISEQRAKEYAARLGGEAKKMEAA